MRHLFNTLLVFILLLSPVMADKPTATVNFKGIYECSAAGIPLARIGVEFAQDGVRYNATSDIASSAIVTLFTKHSSHTTVKADGGNIDYETHYHTNKKKKYVSLTYKNSEFASENLVPPETHEKRPVVSMDLKKDSVDPLTLILKMREKLITAQKNGEKNFSINVYDGRRLTEVDFNVVGKQSLRMDGKTVPVVTVTAHRKLLGGFTASEMQDYNPKEPLLSIYFSDDTNFWPLKLQAPLMVGFISATLVKECSATESCLLGNAD